MDGVDLSPVLFGTRPSQRTMMIYYRGDELFAIRKGAFKAHFQTAPGYASGGAQAVFEKHDPPLLFQLEHDPSERFDVAQDHPEVVADLRRAVEKHRAELKPGPAQY
jgi:arylsulfatase A-like enzyme